MSLHDQIETDLRAAMKARDRARTSALRMLVAAANNRATADGLGPRGRLDDRTLQTVIATEIKRRREAAEAFAQAGRTSSAESERAEAEIYQAYLPDQLTDDELASVVDEVIADTGADNLKQMGEVMKAVMAKVQGRADGSRVSAVVKQRLAG